MQALLLFHRLGLLVLLLLPCAFSSLGAPSVATRTKPVVTRYHGVQVTDPYQWLEEGTHPTVRRWTGQQNALTRSYFKNLPLRQAVLQQLEDYYEEVSADYSTFTYRKGLLFALKFKPPAQQPLLITLRSTRKPDTEKVLFDPNRYNTNGTTAMDWFVPSPDGKFVAISLSAEGSELGSLHILEVATGKFLADKIGRVQGPTAGGSAAWNLDGTGLYYTRYPLPGERPPADLSFYQQIYFHRLGTPVESDRYELGRDFPRIAEIALTRREDGQYLAASVANGDGGEYAHYLRDSAGQWQRVAAFSDQVQQIEFGRDQALYILSLKESPRGRILRLPLEAPALSNATEVVRQQEGVIAGFKASDSGLYVEQLVGGPSRVQFYPHSGAAPREVTLPPIASVQEMVCRNGDQLLFRTTTYLKPFAWYLYDPASNKVEKTALVGTAPVDYSDAEVVRDFALSRDGTKIPMNILRRKGTRLDGTNPTLLRGYGGYGISLTPKFSLDHRLWLDAGGVVVVANLRGGGEYGEEWHRAGNLTRKQNVFDDFSACAEHLIRQGYTRPGKLAVEGGSNGGLLMGAFLTQHPDLARAVVSHVGIYDMLRVELDPNGAFNVTEFGSVKDPEQFRALHAYSPYHHVQPGGRYPAVLLLTGENDGRVNPAHSRKMTARLQAATASKLPVFLRSSADSGHGMGTALQERIEQAADVYTFLLDQLQVTQLPFYSSSGIARGPWSGSLTATSVVIKARLNFHASQARLLLSTQPTLKKAAVTKKQAGLPENYQIVTFPLTQLTPNTRYFYALEVDGKVVADRQGEFRTCPVGPASFSFAFGSCARSGSTNQVFETIRAQDPLFFMNIGDFHYQNISRNNRRRFRRAYDLVLNSSSQSALYRNVAFDYVWDDHDFGGDNSNRKASSHEAARLTYDEYTPHYPLAFGNGDNPICHSFSVGRARFIVTDLRSERDDAGKKDDATKSMMGEKQKAWFKQELLAAKGKYPLIFWVSSVPWVGGAGTNYYNPPTNALGFFHHQNLPPAKAKKGKFPFGEDYWSVYATERREIADFIRDNQITGVCLLQGDSHMLAADDGTHSDYATGGGAPLPVLAAAPLDQDPSLKGGPYSQGVYKVGKNEGCFGLVTVKDAGDKITVVYSGRNLHNEEKVALTFSVPVSR